MIIATIASIAAAISASSSLVAINQTREGALLERRVNACSDINRRAAEQIGAALRIERAALSQTHDAPTQMQRDTDNFLRWAREPGIDVARIDERIASEEFQASQAFDLLGPDNLARSEQALGVSLNQMSQMVSVEDDPQTYRASIDGAEQARQQFRNVCRSAIRAYRAR